MDQIPAVQTNYMYSTNVVWKKNKQVSINRW